MAIVRPPRPCNRRLRHRAPAVIGVCLPPVAQAKHLKDHAKDEAEPVPTPEKNAKRNYEIKTYMDKHKIYQVLNKHVMDLLAMAGESAGLPDEPMPWLAQRFEAHAVAPPPAGLSLRPRW